MLDLLPELGEARQAIVRFIAGDQAGIDGADRGADDPIRLDTRIGKGLNTPTMYPQHIANTRSAEPALFPFSLQYFLVHSYRLSLSPPR